MRENKIIKKTYYCILFIFVIYLSYNYIYYYKERIANSDDFFPFYNIIEHNIIDMMHFRFLQGLYSIPVIISKYLGFEIITISKIYALVYSIPIFITLYYLFIVSKKHFIIFLLSFTMFISYQYYYIISEYWLGSCLFFIFYMIIDECKHYNIKYKIISIILLLNIINLHLSLIYPSIFIVVYLFIKGKLNVKNLTIYLSIIFIYIYIKISFLTSTYEYNILYNNKNILSKINIFNSRIINDFLFKSLDWIYIFFIITFLIYGVKTKKINNFIFIILIIFILIPLFIISYIFSDFPYFFYVIGNLRILLLFLPILFFDFCPNNLFKPIVFILIFTAIYNLEIIGHNLKYRYNSIVGLLQESNGNTVYTYNEDVCLVHFKYIFMQTMTINILSNNKNNYILFLNKNKNNLEYLNDELIKFESISKKEYKNKFTQYNIKELSETKYSIYDFLIDKNITECLLEQ